MTWSAEFIDQLSDRSLSPIFILHFWDGNSYGAAGVGNTYVISSHPYGPAVDEIKIARDGVSIGSASVTPGAWSYTAGTWTVQIAGEIGELLQNVTRGSLAQLRVAFDPDATGWGGDMGEPIAIGVLTNIRGRPPTYTLEFWDVIAAMQSRRDVTTFDGTWLAGFANLFYNAGRSSTLAADFDPSSDSDFELVSSTNFEKGATSGLVRIEPSSGSADPYYVSWTSLSTNTFSGLSVGLIASTTSAAVIGDEVYNCGYLYDRPGKIIKRLMTSTGAGSNGTADVYPASWGFGLPYTWIDFDDLDQWSDQVSDIDSSNAKSDQIWQMAIEEPISNAASWLSSVLSASGCWLVTRQGRISMRCCQDPEGEDLTSGATTINQTPIESGITITDHDISEIIEWEAFDSQVPAEAGDFRAYVNDNVNPYSQIAEEETASTLPAYVPAETDLRDIVHGAGAAGSLDSSRGTAYRMGRWTTRIPERLTIDCAGLRMAQLVPGDLVRLTTSHMHGRLDSTALEYDDRAAMVLSVSVNWHSPRVSLSLSILPSYAESFSG